jgi:hypothetical protein
MNDLLAYILWIIIIVMVVVAFTNGEYEKAFILSTISVALIRTIK